jgi:hypothetical protein
MTMAHTISVDVVIDRSGTKKPGFRTIIFPGNLAANLSIYDGYSLGLGKKSVPSPSLYIFPGVTVKDVLTTL